MKPTKIEWTEATWNPSIGCSKVTSGCNNCYAAVMVRRLQAMGAAGYEDGFVLTKREQILQCPDTVRTLSWLHKILNMNNLCQTTN